MMTLLKGLGAFAPFSNTILKSSQRSITVHINEQNIITAIHTLQIDNRVYHLCTMLLSYMTIFLL